MTSHHVLAAMVRRLLPRAPALDPPARATVERDVSAFVGAQVAAMPRVLRRPLGLALAAFDLAPLAWRGRRFVRLPADRQAAYLARWSDAPLGPMRDLVKLVRSCALLAFYDHDHVAAALRDERASGAATARAPVDRADAAPDAPRRASSR